MPEAVWFAAPGRVEIRAEPSPDVGPRDIRVRALVSGISAGSELLVYRGQAPAGLAPDLPTVAGSFGLPIKFGYASVGSVVEAGREVTVPAPGDLVFVHHPHQTELVVPAASATCLPPGLPPEVGIFTANLETALTIVLDAHPRLAEAVLVVGQGIVGLLTTMLLRRAGARPIVAVDSLPRRREASLAAGADEAVDTADVASSVARVTAGRGVDVSIEVSGNPAGLQACIDATASTGTVVVASWYGTQPVTLALGERFHRSRLRLVGSQVATLDAALTGRWDRARRGVAVSELLTELPLAGLISHRFPFGRAADAYELLDHQPGEALQVLLEHV